MEQLVMDAATSTWFFHKSWTREFRTLNTNSVSRLLGSSLNTSVLQLECDGTTGPQLRGLICNRVTCDELEWRSPCFACFPHGNESVCRYQRTTFPKGGMVSGSCNDLQLLCPVGTHVAVMTTWKAASTSAVEWARSMNSDRRDPSVGFPRLKLIPQSPESWLAKLESILVRSFKASYGCYHDWASQDVRSLVSILYSRSLRSSGVIGLPAHACVPCCVASSRRLVIVVARNPYSRLLSMFKMDKMAHHRTLFNQTEFASWVESVTCPPKGWQQTLELVRELAAGRLRHRGSTALLEDTLARFGWTSSNSHVSIRDFEHTMPITERATLFGVDLRQAAFLRVESIVSDLNALQQRLCNEFQHSCEGLPQFPWFHKRVGSSLDVHWTKRLQTLVRKRYLRDFETFGYSLDPRFDTIK